MQILKTDIQGPLIIEPKVFGGSRENFFESFNAREFKEKTGLKINFVQDNESMSTYGVMRGLHFQRPPYTQSKLVRCVKGRVLDVAVDIRRVSPNYGRHVAVELTEDNHRQFFVPKGFAHGFAVLSETAVFQYKCDNGCRVTFTLHDYRRSFNIGTQTRQEVFVRMENDLVDVQSGFHWTNKKVLSVKLMSKDNTISEWFE